MVDSRIRRIRKELDDKELEVGDKLDKVDIQDIQMLKFIPNLLQNSN